MLGTKGESAPGRVGIDLDLLYAVTQSQSADDLRSVAEKFCAMHQFSRWIYGLAGPDLVLTNYPAHWMASYIQNRYHRGRDPLINAINERRRSVPWDLRKSEPLGQPLDADQKCLMGERWDVGARAGVTAPVYEAPGRPSVDFAVVSFSREEPLTDFEQRHHEPCVQLFATYFQSVAPSILSPVQCEPAGPIVLTPRERDCLSWAARGKCSWEIGQLLFIGAATVNFHIANAAEKLGVRGRVAAISQAIRLELINPQ